MRIRSSATAVALLAAVCFTSAAHAVPSPGAEPSGEENASSISENTRLFCYNRSSGRFLHWGRCGGGVRVYCKNRYTGRFLHWGACY